MGQQYLPINFEKHSNKPRALGAEISDLILGIKKTQKARYPFWEAVVGERVANIAMPVRNKKGVLMVKVRDSSWRFVLTREKEDIVININRFLKKEEIKDIIFI